MSTTTENDQTAAREQEANRLFHEHFMAGRSSAIRAAATPSVIFEGRTQLSDPGYARRMAAGAASNSDARMVAYWLGYAEQAEQLR